MASNMETVETEVGQKDAMKADYGSFKIKLADILTLSMVMGLATLFGYPPSLVDELDRQDNRNLAMVRHMEERGQIKASDITPLLKGLRQLSLSGIESSVRKLFEDCTGIRCSGNAYPKELEERKGNFVDSLRERYSLWYSKIQPIPYIKDKIYCVNDVFVEVGIMKVVKSVNPFKRSLEHSRTEELSSFSDVFDDNKLRTNRILLEGDPGYGKSTFTLQAAYEWCSGRKPSPLKLFEIFILLPLRLLKNISSIFEAIRLVLMPAETNLTDRDIKDILTSCSQGVIVLDGYDEYPDRDNKCESDFMKIIKGTMFANFKVILTTRSSSLPQEPSPSTVTIKLTGFSDISVCEYVKRAVTGGNENEAKKIKDILTSTPVLADICQVPIFCVLFAHITHEQQHSLARCSSVTSFFRYTLSCFYSHMRKKRSNDTGDSIPEYTALNKLAFDSLIGKDQQIRWPKESFIETVGIECFKELSGIGILIEEEDLEVKDEPGVDVSHHIRYRKFVRFYHKLFVEWYAGIYLSSYAGGFWPISLTDTLKKINPVDLQYVFRFASGLNNKACDRIVRYLQRLDGGKIFASLCFFEQSTDQARLSSMVRSLCSDGMKIRSTDSKLLQRSSIQILDIASRNEIPVSCLVLDKSVVDVDNEKLTLNTGFSLPPLKSVQTLEVKTERGEEYTAEKFLKFLSYCQRCGCGKSIYFIECLLPVSMESFVSVTESFKWKVFWRPVNDDFRLDSLTGKWKLQQSSTTDIQDSQLSPALCRDLIDAMFLGELTFLDDDSKKRQGMMTSLLQTAVKHAIPISSLVVDKSLLSDDRRGINIMSGCRLPKSLETLEVRGKNRIELSQETMLRIICNLTECPKLKKLTFSGCLLPISFLDETIFSAVQSTGLKVFWRELDKEFYLDRSSCSWKIKDSEDILGLALKGHQNLRDMCQGTTSLSKADSKEFQRSTILLLEVASNYRIPISCLVLDKLLVKADQNEILCTSEVRVFSLVTLEKLEVISEKETNLSQDDVLGVMKYARSCHSMSKLTFDGCLLPFSFDVKAVSSIYNEKSLAVFWRELDQEFRLDQSSGNWIMKDSEDILGLALKNHQNLRDMCQERTFLRKTDSKEFQRSMILLLEIASNYSIPISELSLVWSFRGFDGDNIRLESGLCISSLSSVEKISINGGGNQQLSEEEVTGLLNFGMKSTRFKELWFFNCKLPPSINPASLTEAMGRNAKVLSSEEAKYLGMENGIWKEPEDIETIKLMCSDQLTISNKTSESVQRSVIELLVKASTQDIPISWVCLAWSFDKIDEDGRNIILKSGLLLPNISSMEVMMIQTEKGREMKEEEVNGILNYLQQNKRLKTLSLSDCVLPSPISLGPSASTLRSRNVNVFWKPDTNKAEQYYRLDLVSGHFEKIGTW